MLVYYGRGVRCANAHPEVVMISSMQVAFSTFFLVTIVALAQGYKVTQSCEGKGVEVGDISNTLLREHAGLGNTVINWRYSHFFMNEQITVATSAKAMFSNMHDKIKEIYPGQIELFANFSARDDPGNVRKYVNHIANSTRVVLLRDPFDRLLSAFSNSKVHPGISVGYCCNNEKIDEHFTTPFSCVIMDEVKGPMHPCGLKEFVLEMNKYGLSNSHLAPQYESVNYAQMSYHYVLRINSKADEKCLWELLDMKPDGDHNQSPNHNMELANKAKLFDDEMIEILNRLYEVDIMLWKTVKMFPGAEPSVFDYLH